MFMFGLVIEAQVDGLVGGSGRANLVAKSEELLVVVPRLAAQELGRQPR